jgi:hypothetical protein
MPHALSLPAPGFQAIILCGPGSSFPTFTANPDENPKALIPIANRPMVWYPIDFCYRMGVTSEYIHFTCALGLVIGIGSFVCAGICSIYCFKEVYNILISRDFIIALHFDQRNLRA